MEELVYKRVPSGYAYTRTRVGLRVFNNVLCILFPPSYTNCSILLGHAVFFLLLPNTNIEQFYQSPGQMLIPRN